MLWKKIHLSYLLTGLIATSLTVGSALAQEEDAPAEEPAAESKPAEEKPEAKPEEKPADEKKPAEKKEEKPAEKKDEKKPADEKKDETKKEEKPAAEKKMEKPAEEAKEKAAEAGPEAVTLVTNLETPTGIAIHEKTGDIFVSSRYGVYRYDPVSHEPPNIEIVGFPVDVYGSGPKYDIAPLGLGFLDNGNLIVGGGSREDGEELVHVFKIADDPADPSLTEEDAVKTLGPIKEGAETALGEPTTKGEGNFYDVAVGSSGVFISSNGDDTKGWVLKIDLKDGKLGDALVPTIATKVDSGVDAPVPVAYSLDGKSLYVGQMGEVNVPKDSLFLVYDAATNKLTKEYELGLHDPAGLAISPKTKKIYVTDYAWVKPEEGGLYEVIIEGDKLTTKKILSLDKPTDIEFDKDGKLYVTVVGTLDEKAKTKDGEQLSPGKLLVIDAGL